MGNYKTAASASAVWLGVRKKLQDKNAAGSTSTGKASAGGGVTDDETNGDPKFTPINTPKKGKARKNQVKKEDCEGEQMLSSTPTKKRGRKPKEESEPSLKRIKTEAADPTAGVSVGSAIDETLDRATISPTDEAASPIDESTSPTTEATSPTKIAITSTKEDVDPTEEAIISSKEDDAPIKAEPPSEEAPLIS